MDWLRGLRRPSDAGRADAADGGGPPLSRLPGAAALFEGLHPDGRHVILDLGPASEAHLRLLGRYAQRIRFADLLPAPPRGVELTRVLEALPPNPGRPYDVVLAWNLLDLLEDRERVEVVDRLRRLSGPGARLHVLVDGSEASARPAVRFTLRDLETVEREDLGRVPAGGRPLLPAHVEQVLDPFRVVRGFTLRDGLREYVAVRARE